MFIFLHKRWNLVFKEFFVRFYINAFFLGICTRRCTISTTSFSLFCLSGLTTFWQISTKCVSAPLSSCTFSWIPPSPLLVAPFRQVHHLVLEFWPLYLLIALFQQIYILFFRNQQLFHKYHHNNTSNFGTAPIPRMLLKVEFTLAYQVILTKPN